MCGIFGQLSPTLPPGAIEATKDAIARLRHRGPDGSRTWFDGQCVLGHARLKIIDLTEDGAQPMVSATQRRVITFNGEIYNYRELRETLAPPPGGWRSTSDTEVLLQALETRGHAALNDLVGMFAFALWSPAEHELLLVRDRLGKKPLFYTLLPDGGLRFSSELPALLADPSVRRRTSLDRVAEYLQAGYVNGPRTPFLDIAAVPPGHLLRARLAGDRVETKVERYWGLPVTPAATATNEDEWLERFGDTLRNAIRIRLRSDVPVSALLSGGVDSSVVCLLAAEEAGAPLHTITVDSGGPASEARYADEVARSIHSNHSVATLPPLTLGSISEFVELYPELMGDPSAISALSAFRAVRDKATVTLTGDGGDELLFGYTRYFQTLHALERNARIPALVTTAARVVARRIPTWLRGDARLSLATGGLEQAYEATVHQYPAHAAPPLLARECAVELPISAALRRFAALPLHQRLMSVDAETYIPGDTLVTLDRASMAVSLELRSPLLDHRLFELMREAPFEFLIDGERGKRPFRRLFASRLPWNVFNRQKAGFTVPLLEWMRAAPLESWLAGTRSPLAAFIDAREVRRMVRGFRLGVNTFAGRLWHLLVLSHWLDRWQPALQD